MKKSTFTTAALLLLFANTSVHAGDVRITLRGSHASMERQNRIARQEDFSFLRTSAEVSRYANHGWLVRVNGNADYDVIAGWPYTRPVVRGFIETLARDYRAACGEQLVVTSLTRPVRAQPRNASPLSVHPAGMAVDLRVSSRSRCVQWLAEELLRQEEAGLLDGTRERHPPHFHVAVFPEPYEDYLAARAADSARVAEAREDSLEAAAEQARLAALVPVHQIEASPPQTLVQLTEVLFAVARLLLRV